ncbi:hypothetical protein DP939_44545 [Spongiactinospora rosea]|uniref:Uncharacterized protein n=1 Tax=Spongiactinospora rosea TaxID=2248750 RepID=A0A366LE52_9ACTN|nr:hypothetical protein [Spongiactinospora rosea]RBQ12141.1 hypothetical protein DP939_44545 [Spongiactinospora rosea]
MSYAASGKSVPTTVPGEKVTPEDMARVTADDWAAIQRLARGYCRTVDATRSRKRMDGSATIVNEGHAPYGTDDVSDDVTQDAVLLFAQKLRDVVASCRPAPESTAQAPAWIYVRRDGGEMTITRTTLHRWVVRDAAARNGYRVGVPAGASGATPGVEPTSGSMNAESLMQVAAAFCMAQNSATIFRQAFGDGEDFPTIKDVMEQAAQADDLGRAGILSKVAQKRYGGVYGSRSAVIRVRDAARAEWRDLSERLDDVRGMLKYFDDESTGE